MLNADVKDVPLISVVMPCYNHIAYVEQAITSVLRQDHESFELIVVDDCSVDGSYELLEGLSAQHGFRLLRLESNQGVCAAMNRGLAIARGKFIATMDSDDVMLPGRLSLQSAYLEKNSQVGLVGGKVVYIDRNGSEIKREKIDASGRAHVLTIKEILSEAFAVGGPVSMYRLDILNGQDPYDDSLRVQDFQMTLKVAASGKEVHVLPSWITAYRRHGTNISRTQYRRQFEDDMHAIAPFNGLAEYQLARRAIINKALKHAVKDSKIYAVKLFFMLPFSMWNSVTLKRLLRFFLSW
ncbi:glycosyltransferase family 2 protein [Pseudomonas oryzihabitans]|uniref:glycosyltransferase family 2 protein n=1 Tax=Pseudomonas oryzihabitans TaxID=47885 RepID=UPI000B1F53AB|nr:glycosyltransferase family 2 protein [Pseudomonas oryzihabitans]